MKKQTSTQFQSIILVRQAMTRYYDLALTFSILLFSFNSKLTLGRQPTELKEKLHLIRQQLDSYEQTNESDLPTNPLENESFSQLKSSGYLYLYRGIAYTLITLNKKNSYSTAQKINFLKKALQDIKQSSWVNRLYEKKAQEWLNIIYNHLILMTFSKKQYFQTIYYIEKQALDLTPKNAHNLYAAYSFFETKQLTRLKRLLNTNPLFYQQALDKYPLNEAASKLKQLIKTTTVPNKKLSNNNKTTEPFPTNKQAIYDQIDHLFDQFQYRYYSSEFAKYFDRIISLYITSLSTKDGSTLNEQHQFIDNFNKNTSKLPPMILIKLIKKLWQNNRHKLALKVSNLFLEQFTYHPSSLKVLYNKARLLEELRNYESSLLIYDSVIQQSIDTKYHEKASYRKALILNITKNKRADKAYDYYLTKFPSGENASTTNYFKITHDINAQKIKSKNYLQSDELQKKVSTFIKQNPISFYSVLMGKDWNNLYHKHFSKLFHSNTQPLSKILKTNTFFPLSIKDQLTLDIYQELKDFGLEEDAKHLLNTMPFDKENTYLSLYLLKQYQNLKDLPKIVINTMLSYRYFPKLTEYLSIKDIFPEYKKEDISSLIKKHQSIVSPHFVMSLIRQESAFDPFALSSANAMGLMQIIPSTARLISKKIDASNYNMHHAEHNLNFGIYYLSTLLTEFDNNIIFTLAAYNAGKNVAKRWKKTMGHLEPLHLIESIPYRETRNYIKFILRNYAIYQLLYEKKNIAYVHTLTNQQKL